MLSIGGARYTVGQPGDAVAVGDWRCSGRVTAVVLRPASGELFAFDEWAGPGRDVTARPIGRVEGAIGVRAAQADGERCQHVEVLRSEAPPARVEVGR